MTGVTAGLRDLLGKLVSHRVQFDNKDYGSPDHTPEPDLNKAHVISSRLKPEHADAANVYRLGDPDSDDLLGSMTKVTDLHQIVIDVDLPVHVVESSTPGHHHLYVELERPVPTEAYFEWLQACAKIGLVEPGYVSAFEARGFSCVRLPWVAKGAEVPEEIALESLREKINTPTEIPTENLGGLFG